jgi:hypothetical protein
MTSLFSASMNATISTVTHDKEITLATATLESSVEVGVTGFIVHPLKQNHQIIIANLEVLSYDKKSKEVTFKTSPYTGLTQNSLPNGNWEVTVGDEAIFAFAYNRALLIAPDEEIYHFLSSKIPSIEWVHPDKFATFLSYKGHPTPLKEDFRDFCVVGATGLLYLYLEEALFTLDCKSFSLLQITPAAIKREKEKLPFYSRVDKIYAGWFGKGTSELEVYDEYYLELLNQSNQKSTLLSEYNKKSNKGKN